MKARSNFFSRPAGFAAALTFSLATIPAHAIIYYWDNDVPGAGFGTAGGSWTAPTLNQWSTDATGTAAPGASITTGTGDDLHFGTSTVGLASGSISVGTVSARSITFGSLSGAITLTGGSIALSGNIAASAANPAATHTIASDIVLSGNRKIGAALAEKYILTGNISGPGSGLEIDPGNTTGSVTLNGNNSFTGNVQISRGQLKVNTVSDKLANSALGAGSKISMGLGGGQGPILWYSGTSAASTNRDFEFNSTAAGSIFSQDAPLTLSGTFKNIVAGATATLFLSGDAGGGANLNEVSGTVQDNGTSLMAVQLASSTPIGGSAENGFWKLSGNNSYSGATTVSNGSTLVISHNNALGNSTGGTFVNNNSQLLLTGNIAVGAEALTLASGGAASWNGQTGAGLRNYSGSNSFAGAITLSQASTIATNSGSTLTLTGGITGAQNLTFNSDGDTTVSTVGITTGTGSLTKTGAGTLKLSAVNTYSGQTNVNAGTLVIAGNQTGATQLVVSNNGILQFGDGTSTNGSSVNSGTIFVNNSGTVQVNKADGGTVTLAVASNPSATTTLKGVNAAGTTNTFTATSYNNGGGFAVNSSISGATLAFSGASGAIDLKGTNLTVSGAGDTLLTSAGQGFYSSTTASKVIKQGNGTLIFQGNQGFTGNMEIDAGTVRVDVAQTNSGTYFVGNGTTPSTSATLLLGGGAAGLSGGVSFNRTVSINPGNGTNRTIGGTNTSGTNSFSSAINMSGSFGENRSVTLTAATGGMVEINGVISGAGQNISKSGGGTVVLANTNGYTGTTSITEGKLLINGNQSTATGAVSVSGLATLGGSGTVGGATTVNSTGVHSVGAVATGGADGVAKQTFSSSVTYNTGSIFEWNLAAVPAETGRGTSYDAVNAASLGSTTGAIFRVVLNGAQDFTSTFWDTNRTWADIFKTGDAGSNLSIASIFSGTLQYYNGGGTTLAALGAPSAQGAFTFSGSNLVWTAVPEPTSALAGLLIGAGLLRRRRMA